MDELNAVEFSEETCILIDLVKVRNLSLLIFFGEKFGFKRVISTIANNNKKIIFEF